MIFSKSRWFRRSATKQRMAKMNPRVRLMLQGLEERAVPATITVTNALDDTNTGNGVSLREAIAAINAGANSGDVVATGAAYGTSDSITFSGATTISVNGQMSITKAVTITGLGAGSTVLKNTATASATSRL